MTTTRYWKELQAVRDRRELLRRETWARGSKRIEEAWAVERVLDRASRIPLKLGGIGQKGTLGARIQVEAARGAVEETLGWLEVEAARMALRLGSDGALYEGVVAKARVELGAQSAHLQERAAMLEGAELVAVRQEAKKIATQVLDPLARAERARQLAKGVQNLRAYFHGLPRGAVVLADINDVQVAVQRLDGLLWLARQLTLLLPELVGAPEVVSVHAELRRLAEEQIDIVQRYRDDFAHNALPARARNDDRATGPSRTGEPPEEWLTLPPDEGCTMRRRVWFEKEVKFGPSLTEPLSKVSYGSDIKVVCGPPAIELKGDVLVKAESAPPNEVFPDHPLPDAADFADEFDRDSEAPSKLQDRLERLKDDVDRLAKHDEAVGAIAKEVRKLEQERIAAWEWLERTRTIDEDVCASAGPKLEQWRRDVQAAPLDPSALSPPATEEKLAANAFFLGAAIVGLVARLVVPVPKMLAWGLVVLQSADLLTRIIAQIGITEWALSALEGRLPDMKKISALDAVLDSTLLVLDALMLHGPPTDTSLELGRTLLDSIREGDLPTDEASQLMQVWSTGEAGRGALIGAMSDKGLRRAVLSLLGEARGLVDALSEREVRWTVEVGEGGSAVAWSAPEQSIRVQIDETSGSAKLLRGRWALDSIGRFVDPKSPSARIPLTTLTTGGLPAVLVRRLFEDPLPH